MTDPTNRVPDMPCPKCGGDNVRIRYCDACRTRLWNDACRHGEPEHFHRRCDRCGYNWQTDDVINAQVRCATLDAARP